MQAASYTREQFNKVREMLGQQAVGIAQIAKETGLTRQTVYRIKVDPAGAEGALAAWGLQFLSVKLRPCLPDVPPLGTLWVVGNPTVTCSHLLIELLYQLRHPVGDFLAQNARMELP
jgi:Helix-turn-helix domain of resolvase